jgi:hypothetical protein
MIVERTVETELALCAGVADEIREIRAGIERLAHILVADPRFTADYLDQFQMFDLMAQQAEESAHLLDRLAEGRSAGDAIEAVRLTAMQNRLSAAIEGK